MLSWIGQRRCRLNSSDARSLCQFMLGGTMRCATVITTSPESGRRSVLIEAGVTGLPKPGRVRPETPAPRRRTYLEAPDFTIIRPPANPAGNCSIPRGRVVWCARRDSNAGPFAPEANALSRLSYGRKCKNDQGSISGPSYLHQSIREASRKYFSAVSRLCGEAGPRAPFYYWATGLSGPSRVFFS